MANLLPEPELFKKGADTVALYCRRGGSQILGQNQGTGGRNTDGVTPSSYLFVWRYSTKEKPLCEWQEVAFRVYWYYGQS